MSDQYKIFDANKVFFVTFTLADWISVLEEDTPLPRDLSHGK